MLEYRGNEGEIMAPVTIDRAIENAAVSSGMEGIIIDDRVAVRQKGNLCRNI